MNPAFSPPLHGSNGPCRWVVPTVVFWLLVFAFSSPLGAAQEDAPSLAAGNRRAEKMAEQSKIVMNSFRFLRSNALRISDALLRKQVLELLDNPAPTFYRESPTPADKEKVYQELLRRGFVSSKDSHFHDATAIDGIFPPVADPSRSPQRFWAAPGSSYDGHHSYPGGLVIHEAFNLRSALSLAENYRLQYPGTVVNEDFIIAAPLWHDAMKTVVFQWKADDSELQEMTIASTGAHHILGIAEALHRNLPPRLVVAIAAAHGAPGFEAFGKIAQWIEAAAILAHVDPVAYGVLKKNSEDPSRLDLPWPTFPEATIDNLSDGDFVFSIPAAHTLIDVLRQIARKELVMNESDLSGRPFNHFRNRVFSQMTQERLYSLWLEESTPGIVKELRRLNLVPKK